MKINKTDESGKQNIYELGQGNVEYARYFSGAFYLNPLTDSEVTTASLANVTFESRCRDNWHGQIICQLMHYASTLHLLEL